MQKCLMSEDLSNISSVVSGSGVADGGVRSVGGRARSSESPAGRCIRHRSYAWTRIGKRPRRRSSSRSGVRARRWRSRKWCWAGGNRCRSSGHRRWRNSGWRHGCSVHRLDRVRARNGLLHRRAVASHWSWCGSGCARRCRRSSVGSRLQWSSSDRSRRIRWRGGCRSWRICLCAARWSLGVCWGSGHRVLRGSVAGVALPRSRHLVS